MKITEKLIPINKYNRPGTPKRICVHYTGQSGTDADRLALFYSNVAAGMFPGKTNNWTSTQYIIGLNGKVIRIIPDNEIAYAASGKNAGTLHIEVCYSKAGGEFESASISALRELVQELMKKYSISAGNVLRHYDLTGTMLMKTAGLFCMNTLRPLLSSRRSCIVFRSEHSAAGRMPSSI